jgi:Na+/H+ antiporter NhaD/arsenite permease-like protein
MIATNTFILLFVLTLLLLVTGRYHRSVAALLGAFLTVLFGLEYGLFPTQNLLNYLLAFVDVNTVLLVIGVMILSEAVSRTGFFEFIGLSIAKAVGGGFRQISISFMLVTVLFSAVISNITAMIIMGALTISLAKKYNADPTNAILHETIMTNIGGLMLMISSIPNLIVAANFQLNFIEFLQVSLPLTVILIVVTMFFLIRETNKALIGKQDIIIKVDPWSVVENKRLFYRAGIVFVVVVLLFVFQGSIGVPLGLIAIGGATAILILSGQEPESIFAGIDWGTIFFLTSFYIVVGGLEKSGVLASFADRIVEFSRFNPTIAPLLNVWVTGVPSAVVDNIPMTLTLIPIMRQVSEMTGFPIKILGWAIVFGANLGGNLTPIGSASNIIALGILKKEGKTIEWGDWLRRFGLIVVIQLIIATAYVTVLSVMA